MKSSSSIIAQAIMYLTVFAFSNSTQAYQTSTSDNCGSSCAPVNCCDLNFELKASYLYWNVQEDYLGFAIENIHLFEDLPTPSDAKLKTHDRKWDSGFRLEAFLSDNCYPIGCHFEWTHFKTTSNGSANSAIGDPNPTVGVTTATGVFKDNPFLVAKSVSSTWKIDINQFAFDVDYRLACSPCISFSPYVGVFGAIINQKQNIFNTSIMNNHDGMGNIYVARKNNFWGLGPRFGIGANWDFTQQFSLIFDINFAYLMGKIDTENIFQTSGVATYLTSLDAKL